MISQRLAPTHIRYDRSALFALIGMLLLGAYSQTGSTTPIEKVAPTIQWKTRWCGTGETLFATVEGARASLAQSCSAQCVEYGVDTSPANPDAYYAGANVYQTCPPPTDPIYIYNADFIAARGSCSVIGQNAPGYFFQPGDVPGGGQTSGYCWIWLVKFDQTQKPCDTCVGNPIMPGTGNKRQEEVDYVGTGNAPLAFSRTYNSAV